jgi:hypothetical protein
MTRSSFTLRKAWAQVPGIVVPFVVLHVLQRRQAGIVPEGRLRSVSEQQVDDLRLSRLVQRNET